MLTVKQIKTASIEDLKADFFTLMGEIVITYGDDQADEPQPTADQQEGEGDHAE